MSIRTLLVLLALTACEPVGLGAPRPSPPPAYTAQPPSERGGAAVLADFEYPESMDPLTAATDTEMRLSALVFAPLWGLDPGLKPYPDLAAEVPVPRVAEDGRSMTLPVRLAPGLRWSDGEPITADDVVFSWRRLTDPATQAQPVPGLQHVKDVARRSDSELVWTFDSVYGGWTQLGPALPVLPAHRLGQVKGAWRQDAFFQLPDVASGPFRVTDAAPGQRMTFSANPAYARGYSRHAPWLASILFKSYPGKDSMIAALRTGGADAGFHLSPEDLARLTGMSGSAPRVFTGLRDEFLSPNHSVNRASGRPPPWFGDPAVLDALARSVDREALVREALDGAGDPARGLFPRAMRGWSSGSVIGRRDLEGARRMLDRDGWRAAAGGVREREGRRLEFALLGVCGSAITARELELLKKQWAELGAAVRTDCRRRGVFFAPADQGGTNATGAFDMTLYSNGWGPDPDAWTTAAAAGSAENWGRCADPAIEAAFARGARTLDLGARRAAYQAAEREWLAYHCTIPLFEWPEVRQVSTRLHNFAPNAAAGFDTWNAADWWLARP